MDLQNKSKNQKILGYFLIVLAFLGFILMFVAGLLEGKIISSQFVSTGISSVCSLILGIILIRKSKKSVEGK